jgi:hypothetical protein
VDGNRTIVKSPMFARSYPKLFTLNAATKMPEEEFLEKVSNELID